MGKARSYGRDARSGALWSILRQGGHEVVAIPMSMVMARLLTPREFGVAVAASFFVLLASRLTQFGFSAAIVRTKELRPEHLTSVFTVSMVLGVANYLVLFAVSPAIGRFFGSADAGALVRIAALVFLVSPFSSVASALISRRMQFRYGAISDWVDTLVGAIVTITLAARGWSYWSIPVGSLTGTGVRVLFQLYFSGWWPRFGLVRSALRELLSFGMAVQTKRLLEYAAANIDTLVVGRLLDLTALGFYDKAFSTMNRLVTRLTLGQAPFRIFSIIHEDRARFQRAYAKLIVSVTMLGYPVLALCIAMATPLFDVLYGDQWQAAVFPFQILCVGGMLKLLNAYGAQANEAAGAVWTQAGRQVVGTLLVLIGAAAGSYVGGIAGAAAGVTVAFAILTALMQDLVRRATGLGWSGVLSPQLPGLVCAVCTAGAALGAGRLLGQQDWHMPSWLQLGLQASAAAAVYLSFVVLAPFPALRMVVDDTLADLLPARYARWLAWRRTS